jgi:catechol 2,3-dioxygenase-like lactoylglutathione lyase family enzyme
MCAIFVSDIGVSRAFYEEVLGQRVSGDHGLHVMFVGGFAIWQVDRTGSSIFPSKPSRAHTGSSGMELYFEADDVDAALALVEGSGNKVIHRVREEAWGQRTFRCYDPDGHIIEVGEPMPVAMRRLFRGGSTPETIAKRTSMPMEMVLQAIGYPRWC